MCKSIRFVRKPPGQGRGLIVFDADDTLWFTEPLYDKAKNNCKLLIEDAGLDSEVWEELEQSINIENFDRFKLTPIRFPISCQQAYEKLAGKKYDSILSKKIYSTANQVFSDVASLVPGAFETLKSLVQEFRLVLLSQGDDSVQKKRLSDSGLDFFFSKILIDNLKTTQSFEKILSEDGRPSHLTWSIGNSLASDINPALELGMNAIWIPAPVWQYEKRETIPKKGHLFVSKTLLEAKNKILFPDKKEIAI